MTACKEAAAWRRDGKQEHVVLLMRGELIGEGGYLLLQHLHSSCIVDATIYLELGVVGAHARVVILVDDLQIKPL